MRPIISEILNHLVFMLKYFFEEGFVCCIFSVFVFKPWFFSFLSLYCRRRIFWNWLKRFHLKICIASKNLSINYADKLAHRLSTVNSQTSWLNTAEFSYQLLWDIFYEHYLKLRTAWAIDLTKKRKQPNCMLVRYTRIF